MPDNYDIEKDWLKLKNILKEYESIDTDLYSFLKREIKELLKDSDKSF